MMNIETSELARCISAHIHRDGAYTTPIPGLKLFRESAPTVPDQCIQTPALAVIAQGAKRLQLGTQVFSYDSGQYIVVSLDLPMSVTVTRASQQRPYLGLRFDLDLGQVSSLEAAIPKKSGGGSYEGVTLGRMTADLLDPLTRLLQLLSRPDDIPVIAPLLQREVLYRLMQSEQGAQLRRVAEIDSHAIASRGQSPGSRRTSRSHFQSQPSQRLPI